MAGHIEIWGGLECTVARIGDHWRDQTVETGHHARLDDLDRIADLGIRTLRYPVLWETVSPDAPDRTDFGWHDARLRRLEDHGIRAIAGLCHHGSGPRYTDMLQPDWPDLLAGHARRVAERYPHLALYTPVNEPLTTARFSGLYGFWYPHATGYPAFLRALVNQCKATVLAMRAIRTVRPDARLVQTDDLGKTFSTPLLRYQADHENERRWLTFDLLCGMVGRDHPWWQVFLDNGVAQADLELFLAADAAPDIIGINHYLTSERWLDENLSRYPRHHWGGNAFHRYADAEAVRMAIPHDDLGPAARLRETWDRYRRPIAVTEVHHGCSRDEQLRWILEVWNSARTVQAEGADIRAVTMWSLFGTVDWNSLLTRRDGCYEPGHFDIRGPVPRRTVLADAAEALAREGSFDHPVLDRAGWWRRDIRFYTPSQGSRSACSLVRAPRKLLIAGAGGTLGRAFARIAHFRGLDHVAAGRAEMDIADPRMVARMLEAHRPWAVVNCAGFVRPADAAREARACRRDNARGAAVLARACADAGIPLVTFSSDLVFAGAPGGPWREDDPPVPACVYGESKAEAERQVRAAHDGALVVRTGAFFGPWDEASFAWRALRTLSRGQRFEASPDVVSPTYVPDLVHEVLNLLIDGATGIWHLANPGAISWADFARVLAERTGLDPGLVAAASAAPVRNTALESGRGVLLPPLAGAIDRFLADVEVAWDGRRPREAAE